MDVCGFSFRDFVKLVFNVVLKEAAAGRVLLACLLWLCMYKLWISEEFGWGVLWARVWVFFSNVIA